MASLLDVAQARARTRVRPIVQTRHYPPHPPLPAAENGEPEGALQCASLGPFDGERPGRPRRAGGISDRFPLARGRSRRCRTSAQPTSRGAPSSSTCSASPSGVAGDVSRVAWEQPVIEDSGEGPPLDN